MPNEGPGRNRKTRALERRLRALNRRVEALRAEIEKRSTEKKGLKDSKGTKGNTVDGLLEELQGVYDELAALRHRLSLQKTHEEGKELDRVLKQVGIHLDPLIQTCEDTLIEIQGQCRPQPEARLRVEQEYADLLSELADRRE